jgi:hypothetical protein
MTCAEKVEAARQGGVCTGCVTPLSLILQPRYNHTLGYPVGTKTPKWWYVAVANCNGGPGGTEGEIGLDYFYIHFTNQQGYWSYEYSKDVQGICEMSITFLSLYLVLLAVLAWIKQHAKQKNLQYTVVKYLFVSLALEAAALLFNLCHYAKFGVDGIGVPALEAMYYFFDFIAGLVLLDVVLNVCKGVSECGKWRMISTHA